MNNICVFCGSGKGNEPVYYEKAVAIGKIIAKAGKTLIYGGGNVGLMGAVADSVMENGGSAIGVIPDFLMKKEVGHLGLSELIVVKSMHERKQKMAELADAFLALPGGLGTLEELAEILTWVQLGIIKKPVGLFNLNGYYSHLLAQLDVMVHHGFLRPQNRKMLISIAEADDIIPQLSSYRFGKYSIWDDLDRT